MATNASGEREDDVKEVLNSLALFLHVKVATAIPQPYLEGAVSLQFGFAHQWRPGALGLDSRCGSSHRPVQSKRDTIEARENLTGLERRNAGRGR